MKLSTEAHTFTKNLLDRPWLTVGEAGEIALGHASEVKVLKPTPMPLIRPDGVGEGGEETSSRFPFSFAMLVRHAAWAAE